MTVPRISGQGKALFHAYGSTTLPLLSSWTLQSGENRSRETKCDKVSEPSCFYEKEQIMF